MTPQERTETLKKIMADNKLLAKTVGALIGKSAQTVRTYRCAGGHRVISPEHLRLLELELAAKAAAK